MGTEAMVFPSKHPPAVHANMERRQGICKHWLGGVLYRVAEGNNWKPEVQSEPTARTFQG